MTKKSFKDIVEYIQKYAGPPIPRPSGGYVPTGASVPTPTNVPSPGSPAPAAGGQTGYRNPGIVKMQEALVGLAQDVVAQLKPQDITGQGQQKQEAEGRDSFADFFAKHYLRNGKVPSVEFNPDPTKTDMVDKDPRSPSKLNWVMDTMQRLGSSKTEKFVDGNWGPRTNASLTNSYALAAGLLQLASELKVPVHSYNEASLDQLKKAITTDNSLPITKKVEYAPLIAQHLQLIRKMYNEVKNGILEKPQWRAYIENDKPYIQYKGQSFTPQQLDALKQTYSQGFTVPIDNKGAAAKITIDDLSDTNTLDKWISQFPEAKLDPYNVLTLVSNQISKGA